MICGDSAHAAQRHGQRRTEHGNRRQRRARHRTLFHARLVVARINAPFDIMQNAVAWTLIHRANQFTTARPSQLDRIVESTAGEALDARPVWPAAKDASRESVNL